MNLQAHLDQTRRIHDSAHNVLDLVIGGNSRSGRSFGGGGIGAMVPGHRSTPLNGGCSTLPRDVPVTGPCPPEFLCDCDLVGTTTMARADFAAGVAANAFAALPFDNFDAAGLQPVAVWFTAFTFGDANTIANPVVELPCQIDDVRIGGSSQLRARGQINGLNSAAFAATREPVCVDWGRFTSIPGQELTVDIRNIVNGAVVHFAALLWCNVLQ